jgi:hypothetical protein
MAARNLRSKREENTLKWRAVAAFAKYAEPSQLRASFDDMKARIVETRDHLGAMQAYVVLTSGKTQLAVFRVRNDGQLKRLRRPPRELQTEEE